MRLQLPKTFSLPSQLPVRAIGPAAFALAGLLSIAAASWTAGIVERRSAEGVEQALATAGHNWTEVATDGLQVTLSGIAPTEAARFRALSVAGTIVDADRLVDAMEVAAADALKAPDFTIEILRNGDGISLIGLVPQGPGHEEIVESLTELVGEGAVTDMLESADHPIPSGWQAAVSFGIDALEDLPRSKISISATEVAVTAISDSAAEKARLESDLRRKAPRGLRLALDISAPRPVITPFTLRFLIDGDGARFDACSADSDRARERILAAATDAGATGKIACTIGLGVPTPAWAEAVTMGLAAMKEIGAGSITYSDADISLIAAETVDPAVFDKVVGELESNLPEVFSLHAVLTPKAETPEGTEGPKEFVAKLDAEGRLEMRGRLGDDLSREAVESFARARFGTASVHAATRLDPEMPVGWPLRVLTAIEALGELESGEVTVQPGIIRLSGVTGSTTASDAIARILSDKLGETQQYDLDIRYDEKLDPLLGLPTAEECVADINGFLAAHKINFEPGSAQITRDAADTLDKIAERMKDCADFEMEIGGHTDSQGREEMNLDLSQKRAEAVIAALMSRRVLTGNLTAVGYGETLPIADNDTEAGREANRRIEVRLLGSEATGDLATVEDGTADAEPSEIAVQTPGPDTVRPKPRPSE
ncbi:OmpA family protein [Defluviimonas sp. WL0050]|uniref:OmpA family protein n=1 Tax=Albidovulum litorale TaxID=2984134 RepID=A0ABT2ZSC6_9RHOB|nr:OmpA family protein [Defluviimonas sp. WL0050]MCV2874056.1 OmpA family protein [Defluviimonas sp. WL0050]